MKSYGERSQTVNAAGRDNRPTAKMGDLQDILAQAFAPEKQAGHRRGHAGTRSLSVASSAIEEKRRILIVDDDPNSSHLIKILLEKVGRYVVLEENDAANARHTAQNFRPDLILLDIMMPQADGGDIAAQIDADPGLQKTPIIFLTALVTKAEAKAGLYIQGHPVVAKPVNIPELINTIEENLPAA
ncbi:MAG TPA: response regulator [Candidatus Udaeobacter sp.]|nr:response regulator [Candidatus Udaeobacter sp.]